MVAENIVEAIFALRYIQAAMFVEINREIISTAILLPSADSNQKGCWQLQAKVFAGSTG